MSITANSVKPKITPRITPQLLVGYSTVSSSFSVGPKSRETKSDTNEQIADKMDISYNTIRTHRTRIWHKLEIKHFADCLKHECFFN